MKRYTKWLAIIIFILVMACAEDKGNYDYAMINDVEISGIPEDTSVVQLEVLRLTPVFHRSLDASEAGLTYSWKLAGNEIGTERNLEYTIPQDLDIKKYDCLYTVTDTRNGMQYFQSFNISVNSLFSWGYYFLCEEEDGESVMSYFSSKEGTTECLHTKQVGEYALGKYPRAIGEKFGYIDALDDYFYTMYILNKESENPVIVTNNASFMPSALINNSSFVNDGDEFLPTEIVCMQSSEIYFISNGKIYNYASGLLYRPGKHDKDYIWSHAAGAYRFVFAYDELTHQYYVLKNQINDPNQGLVNDPYALDRVVEIKGQPSFENETVLTTYVNTSQDMYLATAETDKIHVMKFKYIDYQAATDEEPAINELGQMNERVTLTVAGANAATKAILIGENDWYFVTKDKVYTSPALMPAISEFVTLPADIGLPVVVAVSAKENYLIVATYDENSTEEYKGSFVLVNLVTKEMAIHRNVMGKCVVAKGFDANPWW